MALENALHWDRRAGVAGLLSDVDGHRTGLISIQTAHKQLLALWYFLNSCMRKVSVCFLDYHNEGISPS